MLLREDTERAMLTSMRDFFKRFLLKSVLGKSGEEVAVEFVRTLGYRIIAQNVINPHGRRLGEIDIVAQDGACTVFIEVKTRSSESVPFGQTISREKLQRLSKIGEWYMKQSGTIGQPYRFDMIGIILSASGKSEAVHIQNVFL